jgi:hypothetical protein
VRWSAWAKPIAFVQLEHTGIDERPAATKPPAVPDALDHSSAIVVDLPGADAVHMGLSLATAGFRPVPLFNGTSGPSPVIDVSPITRALGAGVEWLERVQLHPDAPPAFLLDSRRSSGSELQPRMYDNRWIVLPQDFPSGALLGSRGIRSVVVIQTGSLSIAPDLAHVLRRWQESGLVIRVIDRASGRPASDVTVPKPTRFRSAWYAAIALFGLRRSNVGGFGTPVPEDTGRGGFYG